MFANVGDGEDKYKKYCKNETIFYENLSVFLIKFLTIF